MAPNENPWSPWVSQHISGTFAHPDAPVGGIGYGFSREVGPSGTDMYGGRAPDPHSPEGRDISPTEAAANYALYEVGRAMEQMAEARSADDLLMAISAAFGSKSFSEGFCSAQRRSPERKQFLELQKRFVQAELYDHLSGRARWPLNAMDSLSFRGPALWQVGQWLPYAGYKTMVYADRLKKPSESRDGLLKELTALFTQSDGALALIKAQLKPDALELWAKFSEQARRTPESNRSEAGRTLGKVIIDVLPVIATLSKTAGFVAKLKGVAPQLLDLAVNLNSGRAGGVADEGAGGNSTQKAGGARKAPVEAPPVRNWEYAPKQSGRVEPGAVQKTPELAKTMKQAEARTAPVAPDGWPKMSDRTATTFGSEPKPVEYAPGTKLYRVIDSDESASGSFWSTEPPPRTEGAWRAGSAVKDPWNGDGGYVEHTVGPEGLKAWVGPAAPQEAAASEMVLPGGAQQAWVPPGTINPVNSPKSSPWNVSV